MWARVVSTDTKTTSEMSKPPLHVAVLEYSTEDQNMKCPLKHNTNSIMDDLHERECDYDDCAWYKKREESCAILGIDKAVTAMFELNQ